MLNIKSAILFCFITALCFYTSVNAQNPKTVYQTEFEQVKTNTYTKKLISYSAIKPPQKHTYKGQPIYTNDSLFIFGSQFLAQAFPTNYKEIDNKYLIFYFSQKSAKCPTLFSLLKLYETIIESELTKNDLPKELKLIPAVCSAFNPNSNNRIGGYGYWHLNHPQAIKYGLTVTEYIDERKDFNKSTKAATLYLKDLYAKYNNWELTLAAYSSGVVNITKLLKRHNATSYKEIADFLPSETKDFVQAFVALNYIYNYDNYGAVSLNPTIKADTINIERKLMFKALNDVIKTKTTDITFLNPTLISNKFPNNYTAYLPKEAKEKFEQMKDSIYFYQDSVLLKPTPKEPEFVIPKDGKAVVYTVRSGDVLGLIASKFGVRVSQIQAWNNLSGTRINIGQKLMIYGKKTTNKNQITKNKPQKTNIKKEEPKETTKPNLTFNNDNYSTYTVKSGDNLWLIAKKYAGVSAQNIMDFNGIDGNLDVGQKLKIPKP